MPRTEKPHNTTTKRRSPRLKPDALAQRAVARAQRETKQYIPYRTFARLVHELLAEHGTVRRITRRATEALWTEAEATLVDVFRAAEGVAATCQRKLLKDVHIRNALRSADLVGRTSRWHRVWDRPARALPPHLQQPPAPVEEMHIEEHTEEAEQEAAVHDDDASSSPSLSSPATSSSNEAEEEMRVLREANADALRQIAALSSSECDSSNDDEDDAMQMMRDANAEALRSVAASYSVSSDAECSDDDDDAEDEWARLMQQTQQRHVEALRDIRERSLALQPLVSDVTDMLRRSIASQ